MSKTSIYKEFNKIPVKQQSKIVTGSIIPRPIAWISSTNKDGSINVAPFSYFNVVSPNILSVSFLGKKDTLKNILSQKEAVINTVEVSKLDKVSKTSLAYPYGESEALLHQIHLSNSKLIKTPRITDSKISFETKLFQHIPIRDKDAQSADLVLLKIVGVHFNKDVYDEEKGYIQMDILNPASRLAGKYFGHTTIDQETFRTDK